MVKQQRKVLNDNNSYMQLALGCKIYTD